MALALQEGAPRLEWVSAKLGTTPRTLQRKLAQAGTAYHAVLEDLLRERSTSLVATHPRPHHRHCARARLLGPGAFHARLPAVDRYLAAGVPQGRR